MKFFVIANCQQSPIWSILHNAGLDVDKYNKPIHLNTEDDANNIRRSLKDVDAVVIQNIVSSKFVELGLDVDSIKQLCPNVCVIPNIHCEAYHPTFISLARYVNNVDSRAINKIVELNGLGPHFDCFALAAIDSGLSRFDLMECLAKKKAVGASFVADTFSQLKQREERCSVIISDWLADNLSKKYLFYTLNHPVNEVLEELCRRIVLYFGKDLVVKSRERPYLSNFRLPVYKFIRLSLGLDGLSPGWSFGGSSTDYSMEKSQGVFYHLRLSFELVKELQTVAPGSLERIRATGNYSTAKMILEELRKS